MASVCTGSLVYAAAGLLSGRRATTHWASLNLLSELDPTVITDVDARFVDDGDLITSAGVSAGIDMALHLVARLAGPNAPARSAARSSTTLSRPSEGHTTMTITTETPAAPTRRTAGTSASFLARRRRSVALRFLVSALFVVMLDTSIVNVALRRSRPTSG